MNERSPGTNRRRFAMKGFYRGIGVLSGGTLVGQLVLVGTAPILTRLYDVDAFGIFAVVTSVAMLVGLVASLRYELALPVVHDDREAASLLVLTLVLGAASGIAFTTFAWFGGHVFGDSLGGQDRAVWQVLVPAMVAFYAFSIILEYWSLRRRNIGINAIMRVVFVGGQVIVQVGCGLLGMGAEGLILGLLTGHVARVIGFSIWTDAWPTLRTHCPKPENVRKVARSYWRYPVFAAPANLLLEIVQLVPVGLVGVVYDARMAGFFGLAQRILEAPIRLLSHSTSLMFLREAADLPARNVMVLFRTVVIRFALLGSLGLLPVALFGPPIFAVVFGEPWRESGHVAQLLLPFQLMRFVAGAVGNALTLHQRNDLQCVTAGLGVVASMASFALGWWMDLSAHTTITIFAIGNACAYGLQLLAAWWVLRAALGTEQSARTTDSQIAHGPTD